MAKPYFTRRRRISLKKAHIVLVDKCVLFSGGECGIRILRPRLLQSLRSALTRFSPLRGSLLRPARLCRSPGATFTPVRFESSICKTTQKRHPIGCLFVWRRERDSLLNFARQKISFKLHASQNPSVIATNRPPDGLLNAGFESLCVTKRKKSTNEIVSAFLWKGRIKSNPQPYMSERTSIFSSPYSILTVFSMPPLKMTSSSFFDTTLMQSTSFRVTLSS